MQLIDFNDQKPNYGDVIVIQHPPEQCKLPVVEIFGRDTDWFDGSCYIKWEITPTSINSKSMPCQTCVNQLIDCICVKAGLPCKYSPR